jgi:hypothetical protein
MSAPASRRVSVVGGLLVAILIFNGTAPAPAAVVKDISTGINPATGAKVPNNTRQSTYVIGPGGTGGQVGAPVVAWSDEIPPYGYPYTYMPDSASAKSRFISIYPPGAPNPQVGLGTFFYQTTVDLASYDPATAAISAARVAVDDAFHGVRVNGTTVFTPPPPGYYANSDSFVDLPASLGAGKFHAGLNTITFVVENVADQSPASLRVEGVVTATPVPEPAAGVALLGAAVFVALLNPRASRYSLRLHA